MRGVADAHVVERIRRQESEPPPDAAELGAWFAENLQPDVRNVVYLAGHGDGTNIGPMHVSTAATALKHAHAATGIKPDLLFIEACAMGHVPGLALLAEVAPVAIVSQETIPVDALPTGSMLSCLQSQRDIRQAAATMIDVAQSVAKGRNGPRAVSAIDLERLRPLADATTRMLTSLATAPHPVVATATKSAMWYIPIAAKGFGWGDVGAFAKHVAKDAACSDEQRQAARDVTAALGDAVLRTAHNREYGGVSGLSFDPSVNGKHYGWWDLLQY